MLFYDDTPTRAHTRRIFSPRERINNDDDITTPTTTRTTTITNSIYFNVINKLNALYFVYTSLLARGIRNGGNRALSSTKSRRRRNLFSMTTAKTIV